MKKTFPVNISGKIFYIDEDAYELLLNYLDQLHSAFSGTEGDEIVTDIESRIAELFDERIASGANAIVFSDVNNVIEIMGKPSDITDCEETASEQPHTATAEATANESETTSTTAGAPQHKFHRSTTNKVLGGVIGGAAEYLGWDANIMRILIVLIAFLSFTWPPLILLMAISYLVAWMVTTPGNSQTAQVETERTQNNVRRPKKPLYRNLNDKVFGGVIGGIATYLGWDANIMRVLIVLISIPTHVWPMALLYLVAWMVIPPANTPRRILEMHGNPVTVDSIGQNVLSSTPPPYYGTNTHNNNFLGRAFSILGKCLIGFLGLIGSVGALVATGFFLFFLTALVAYLCFNSVELLGAFDNALLVYSSPLAPTICCMAIMVLSLCFIIPGTALAWGAAAILFNCKGAAKITIITAAVLEVLFVVATIILFIFAQRLSSC